MSSNDNQERDYDLVVPFVVVASEGGPYDDAAFCAGVEYGRARELVRQRRGLELAIQTQMQAQYDLLAMEFDCQVAYSNPDEDGWQWCLLTPPLQDGDVVNSSS